MDDCEWYFTVEFCGLEFALRKELNSFVEGKNNIPVLVCHFIGFDCIHSHLGNQKKQGHGKQLERFNKMDEKLGGIIDIFLTPHTLTCAYNRNSMCPLVENVTVYIHHGITHLPTVWHDHIFDTLGHHIY